MDVDCTLYLNTFDGGWFPWEDLRKILHGGQRLAKVQNGEEILPKVSAAWVGRTNVTDDRRICDSEEKIRT